jgi:hypothetical protein
MEPASVCPESIPLIASGSHLGRTVYLLLYWFAVAIYKHRFFVLWRFVMAKLFLKSIPGILATRRTRVAHDYIMFAR